MRPIEQSRSIGSMAKRWPKHACPKCNRLLSASGEIEIEGGDVLPVYQCDECIDQVDMGLGKPVDVSLTFAVSADGTMIDPAEPTRQIRFDDASD